MAATRSGWRQRAACRGLNTELFFPVGASGGALDQIELAQAVCARCPVVKDCLSWALDTGQTNGIWGGKTEEQRRALRRHRQQKRDTERG